MYLSQQFPRCLPLASGRRVIMSSKGLRTHLVVLSKGGVGGLETIWFAVLRYLDIYHIYYSILYILACDLALLNRVNTIKAAYTYC